MLQSPKINSIVVVTSDVADSEMLTQAVHQESLEEHVNVIVEPAGHRGPAGVLRDIALGLVHDFYVVGEVTSLPPNSIDAILVELGTNSTVMTIGMSDNRRPIGVYGFTRHSLEAIPDLGFFDVKEQLIPALIDRGGTVLSRIMMPKQLRVTTLPEWLEAIQALHEHGAAKVGVPEHVRVEGASLIEDGVTLHPGVSILSSVVMSGAVIESGAVIARSVIGPGVRVRKGFRIIDGILAGQVSKITDKHRIAPSAQGSGRLGNQQPTVTIQSEHS